MDTRRRWAISAVLVMVLVSGQPATAGATGGAAAGARQVADAIGPVTAVAAGWGHNLGLRPDGTVVAWGYNIAGQLGDGTTADRSTPVRVCALGRTAPCDQFLYAVREVATGYAHSLALRGDGGVVAWGSNTSGQLGNGLRTVGIPVPVRVCEVGQLAPCAQYLTLIRAVASGTDRNLALRVDYTVAVWGDYPGKLLPY